MIVPWKLAGDNEWLRYWRVAETHRDTLTELILGSAAAGSSVCVWGAGSCHDLDLKRLVEAGVRLTLADINEQNVRWGIEFQLGAPQENVQVAAPLDLSGVPRGRRPPLALLAKTIAEHRIEELGTHDVVVSAGMLSQVVLDVVGAAGLGDDRSTPPRPVKERAATSPEIVAALVAARRRHTGLMLEHLKPGGTGLLVIDWVNSSDAPEIVTADDLQATVDAAASATDHTHVLSPANLNRDLLLHPQVAKKVAGVQISNYWLWDMVERIYACFALRFTRR